MPSLASLNQEGTVYCFSDSHVGSNFVTVGQVISTPQGCSFVTTVVGEAAGRPRASCYAPGTMLICPVNPSDGARPCHADGTRYRRQGQFAGAQRDRRRNSRLDDLTSHHLESGVGAKYSSKYNKNGTAHGVAVPFTLNKGSENALVAPAPPSASASASASAPRTPVLSLRTRLINPDGAPVNGRPVQSADGLLCSA